MSSNTAREIVDQLFPAPSPPPSQLSPQRLPGSSLESLAALQEVLKDNHQRYHIFWNHTRFHNHITHRALAIYALGGSAAIIRDYYDIDGRIQRPAVASPEPITEQNFVEHLGDENFFRGYVSFFSEQISQKGATGALEEFLFSEKYNFREGAHPDAQPAMLTRLHAGLLHPLIHLGYGAEFGLKGMLVEALAMAAVHHVVIKGLLPPSLFAAGSASGVEGVASRLSSLTLNNTAVTGTLAASKAGGVHAFDVVARILKDDRTSHIVIKDFREELNGFLVQYSAIAREHAEKWTVDLNQPGEIERKTEELIWLSSLLYGAGGLTHDGFQSDFFLMHQVTSSLFLPSLIAYLSPRSQVLLLRGYLLTVVTWWLVRGRPTPNIKAFMTTTPLEPSVSTTPAPGAPLSTETTPTPNPFLPVVQSAITHPNDHLIKIQRAFAHFDTLYGHRPAGYFKGTELEDAALLDGSYFLRAALLTADYVGWVREGKEEQEFSVEGFYA